MNDSSDKTAKPPQQPEARAARTSSFFSRWQNYVFLTLIFGASLLAIHFGADEKLVALFAILLGLLTQAFAAILGIIAFIPWFGPILVKILSIPIFWMVNAISNLIATVAVKQGFGKEIASSKLMVLVLTIGMILGYLLGHWFPF